MVGMEAVPKPKRSASTVDLLLICSHRAARISDPDLRIRIGDS